MAEPASPFGVTELIAILEQDGMAYTQQGEEPVVLLHLCCERVPHDLRLVVNAEQGFCAVYQHNLGVCSTAAAGSERVGEAARFALMLNGQALFGGFMLGDHQHTSLSFGAVIPTLGVQLSAAQLQQTVASLCGEIDAFYPLLQQVLWGGISADAALAKLLEPRQGGEEDDGADGQPEEEPPAAGSGFGAPGNGQQRQESPDQVDQRFLASYDPTDPFSTAAAEAIVRLRELQEQEQPSPDPGA